MDTKLKVKVFRCTRCGRYLGEMEKGKIAKGVVMYCRQCTILAEPKRNSGDIFSFLGISH